MRYPMKELLRGDERVLRWIINELYLEIYVLCKDHGYRLAAIHSLAHHVRVAEWMLKSATGYSYQELSILGEAGLCWQCVSGEEIDRRSARLKPDALILPWTPAAPGPRICHLAALPEINAGDYWI